MGTSFYRSMARLMAASPSALAIRTPSAVLAGIAQAARSGVLIKGGVHLEKPGAVSALAVDKTGTLTLGRPEVTDVVAPRTLGPTSCSVSLAPSGGTHSTPSRRRWCAGRRRRASC